jgi:carbon-monoxide dehydrogenase large subunit
MLRSKSDHDGAFSMTAFRVSQRVPRREDQRLITGAGRYVADVNLENQAHAVFVRSPHAHAVIRGIDTAAALAAPGVLTVLTGADYMAEGLGALSMIAPPLPNFDKRFIPPIYPLAEDRARRVGDAVAVVVAETRAEAMDAAELVEVDYEPLPSVTETGDAAEPGAPLVWDEAPENTAFVYTLGDAAAVEAAFAMADHVVRQRMTVNRLTHAPMETRGMVASYDPEASFHLVHTGTQSTYGARATYAKAVFHLPEESFRVVAGDVGGSFGMKGGDSLEGIATLWAARRLGRPVKWIADRSEAFLSDPHARDKVVDAELALDKDGHFLAVRVSSTGNLGSRLSPLSTFPIILSLSGIAGVYRTPSAVVHARAVFTNTNTTVPYRGSGRPDSSYIIERLIDVAARRIGMDRAELRRRNIIPPDAMPFQTPLAATYDCGDFVKNFEDALKAADYAGFEARRAEAKARGKLRGIGIGNNVEGAAPPGFELAEVKVAADGSLTVAVGSTDQGQGHGTMVTQIVCDRLGVEPDRVRVLEGDTDFLPEGGGTGGSKVSQYAASAAQMAADAVIEKGKAIASHLLEAAEADIGFADGTFAVVGTDVSVSFADVAAAAHDPARLPPGMEPGLTERGRFQSNRANYPSGCHVCEVEVDPDTGTIAMKRYVAVSDVGVMINPVQVEGQLIGGTVQAVGQVLMEGIRYEPGSGQLQTGSFMDYAMPRADNICNIELAENSVPTEINPVGVKGAGELGTACAVPAVMNAVVDALSPLGIDHVDPPATPERLWRMIQTAKAAKN